MKKLLYLSLLLFLCTSAFGQNTKYKLIYDNPPTPKLNINLEYFNIDMGVSNLDGASFNIGSFGFYEPVEGIGAQYNFKLGLLTFGKFGAKEVPGNMELSAGGYLMLQNRMATKKTKVVLSREYKGSTYSRSIQGDRMVTRTEEVTFMHIPAQRRTMRGLRGGFYMKRGPLTTEDFPGEATFSTSGPLGLTSMGVYAGITSRSIKNVFIETAQHGIQFNSIGDDLVLDLLVVPVNVFRDVSDPARANVSQEVRDILGSNPFGFRIGWYRYQVEKKPRTGKKFGMAAGFEAGFKPYQGIFFNASLGITIVKQ